MLQSDLVVDKQMWALEEAANKEEERSKLKAQLKELDYSEWRESRTCLILAALKEEAWNSM